MRYHEVLSESVTQSPAFKAWFGDSQVIDAAGQPLRVYHGTRKDFEVFRHTAKPANGYLWDDHGWTFSSPAMQVEKSDSGNIIAALRSHVPVHGENDHGERCHVFRNDDQRSDRNLNFGRTKVS